MTEPMRVNGVELGANSPLRQVAKHRGGAKTASSGSVQTRTDDPLDPLGRMNRTERRRAGELEAMRLAGAIRAWYFEGVALILADRTRYHPDFMVIGKLGAIEFEEIKGFWRDDARVKIKVAARLYQHFVFRALKESRQHESGWAMETICA